MKKPPTHVSAITYSFTYINRNRITSKTCSYFDLPQNVWKHAQPTGRGRGTNAADCTCTVSNDVRIGGQLRSIE